MAEKLTYVRVNWEDSPSENTPINSENLNKMDAAIEAVVNLANRHSGQIEDMGNGSGVTTAMSESLWAIIQKTAFAEALTEAELTAFKTAWGIESGGEEPDSPDEPDVPEVTLTSISAVYNGGEVTVGTALTDLTGITVTGTYSDGTTGAITGYTLSGEIVEGSNTITVSYGGKTTTFTVTGVAESGGDSGTEDELNLLPSGTYEGVAEVKSFIGYTGEYSRDTEQLILTPKTDVSQKAFYTSIIEYLETGKDYTLFWNCENSNIDNINIRQATTANKMGSLLAQAIAGQKSYINFTYDSTYLTLVLGVATKEQIETIVNDLVIVEGTYTERP